MTHGKAAARDIKRGRQGGRFVDHAPGELLADLQRFKRAHRCGSDGCRLCNRDLPPAGATFRPDADVEWEGLARMAAARLAAGLRLTPTAIEALDRFPTPPKLTADGYRECS